MRLSLIDLLVVHAFFLLALLAGIPFGGTQGPLVTLVLFSVLLVVPGPRLYRKRDAFTLFTPRFQSVFPQMPGQYKLFSPATAIPAAELHPSGEEDRILWVREGVDLSPEELIGQLGGCGPRTVEAREKWDEFKPQEPFVSLDENEMAAMLTLRRATDRGWNIRNSWRAYQFSHWFGGFRSDWRVLETTSGG